MEGLSSLEGWALIATYFVAMMMLGCVPTKTQKDERRIFGC